MRQTRGALRASPAASADRCDRVVAAATSECVTRMPAALSRLSCARSSCEHFGRRIRIEIARRLVGQHQRSADARARARSRRAAFRRRTTRSADRAARSSMPTAASNSSTRASIAAARGAVERERQRDVALDAQMRQQMKRLEDESHARAPQPRARRIVERGEILTVEDDATRVRRVESGDQIRAASTCRRRTRP